MRRPQNDTFEFGLGRKFDSDDRDSRFPMMAAILPAMAASEPRTSRYWWSGGWWGDQGALPHCVGFAWTHWLEDGPTTQNPKTPGALPVVNPSWLYRQAQDVDEWPGNAYDGTSVRAGAKVLQRLGAIESYYWAWDADTVIQAILYQGPVVVGTWWETNMFYPDRFSVIKTGGGLAGGHAYKLDGVNLDVPYVREKWPTLVTERGVVRIKNSWGRGWGARGYAYMSVENLDVLIRRDGEACIAIERSL